MKAVIEAVLLGAGYGIWLLGAITACRWLYRQARPGSGRPVPGVEDTGLVGWCKPQRRAGPRLAKRIDILSCSCIWQWEDATGRWERTYVCDAHEELKEIAR